MPDMVRNSAPYINVTAIEQDLRQALADFIQVSATRDAGQISAALGRIEALRQQLGSAGDPHLRHYLDNRSYQKALEFLTGLEPEKGDCGR